MLGWRVVAHDEYRRELLYGKRLLDTYNVKGQLLSPELAWFRNAVEDVRDSLGPALTVLVSEIRVYESLRSGPVDAAKSWVQRILGDLFSRGRRPRRGAVLYGAKGILFLSREGLETPRVVYEEVAHCLGRRMAIDDAVGDRISLVAQYDWMPLSCHLEIFRGFLDGSEAKMRSSVEDIQYVETRARMLEEKQRCRLENPARQPVCQC